MNLSSGIFIIRPFIYLVILKNVFCVDYNGVSMTHDELVALTRDHWGRTDPDALFYGYFPFWAAIQFIIGCLFFIVTVIGFVCYLFGCRTPPEKSRR